MRGCIQRAKLSAATMATFKKGEYRWRLVLPRGRDPETNKYKQQWVTFTGTKTQAQAKMRELLSELDRGEFIEPSKVTVGEYFDTWVETAIKPPQHALNTYVGYKGAIDNHLKPALGMHLLQKLTRSHVERYYAESKLSQGTLSLHRAILTCALNAAVTDGLLRRNVATLAKNKPKVSVDRNLLHNVWTTQEARQFLRTVEQEGNTQLTALFTLALDSGLRKSELLGLQWKDLDLATGKLRVERQLMGYGENGPVLSRPKRGSIRSLDLSAETVVLLREHKRQQSELKLKNRLHYEDHGLMFAQAWEQHRTKNNVLGQPLGKTGVAWHLDRLCKAAGVRRITMHGLRHTCATLMLCAGVPAHVVQRRLGHAKVEMTLGIYAHVLPEMQEEAARKMGALLHG